MDLEDSMRVSKEVCKVVELERSKRELRDCCDIGWFEKGASVPPPIVLFKRKRKETVVGSETTAAAARD